MKIDNPFDKTLDAQMRMPESMRIATTFTTDTLDIAWAAVRAVFEGAAKPEHALTLLPIFLARADAERQLLLAEARQMALSASAPGPVSRRKAAKKQP